jgi:hypothetical protein
MNLATKDTKGTKEKNGSGREEGGRILDRIYRMGVGGVILAVVLAMGAPEGARGEGEGGEQAPMARQDAASPVGAEWLIDLGQELYWWYLDEEALGLRKAGGFEFDVRRLTPHLDEGDNSEWIEVRVPQFALGVVAKKPDYRIEELGVEVRGKHFRIVNVFRLEGGRAPTDGLQGGAWRKVRFGTGEVLRRVRERLGELRFPDAELTDRLRKACRRQMELDVEGREAGEQVIYVAPLSDVSNEAWAYLGNQCWLMQFSTEREIEDPEGWDWEDLRVRVYDLRAETVSSMDEMAGSNMMMTMDQAGRALYNCVVLGQRLVIVNPEDPGGEAIVRSRVFGD